MVSQSWKHKLLSRLAIVIVLAMVLGFMSMIVSTNHAHASGGVTYYTKNDGTNFSRSTTPFTSGAETQTTHSDGSVTASISSVSGYADSGYVVYQDTLGSLSNFTLTGSGDTYSTNLWLDTGGNSEFFAWNSSGVLTGLDGDTYALGPGSSSGSLVVSGSTQFYLMSDGQNHTLSSLKNGDVSGISSSTKVAIWIGVNTSSGSVSATTQENPGVSISSVYTSGCVASVVSYTLSGYADSWVLKLNGTQVATLSGSSTQYTDTVTPPFAGGRLDYEIDAIVGGSVYASSVDPQNYPSCPSVSISSVFTYGCVTSVVSYSLVAGADSYVLKRNGTQVATLSQTSTQYTDTVSPPWAGGQLDYEIDAIVNGSVYASSVDPQNYPACS